LSRVILFCQRLLQKSHLKKNNAIAIRDSLRNEVSKHARIGDENKEKREQKVNDDVDQYL
jgi:hypothetical protein